MSGGISQLIAVGAQDVHLTGNPEVSFFRSVYKRHTNFAHVVERQVIQGNPTAGSISTIRLERKGDLVSYIYLTQTDPMSGSVSVDGIDKIELLIGGQVIDTQTKEFISNIAPDYLGSTITKTQESPEKFLPLRFWFCENFQSALPLVSLQYHDVEIRITWSFEPTMGRVTECFADFIYLDTDERQALANSPQEHLIYQVQKANVPTSERVMELNFNHPIKFLAAEGALLTEEGKMKLQINGVDVGENRTYTPHFNYAPRFFHCPFLGKFAGDPDRFLIPFCLDTNKLQPTGTLNFSRLDSVRIMAEDKLDGGANMVYGVNYNILRIQNGMGGLLYAN